MVIPCPSPYWPTPKPYQRPPGIAGAKVNLVRLGPGVYQLTTVAMNESFPPVYPPTTIVLDRLAVTATYGSEKRSFEVAVAGHRFSSGAEAAFDVPESAASGAPTDFAVSAFDFHCST